MDIIGLRPPVATVKVSGGIGFLNLRAKARCSVVGLILCANAMSGSDWVPWASPSAAIAWSMMYSGVLRCLVIPWLSCKIRCCHEGPKASEQSLRTRCCGASLYLAWTVYCSARFPAEPN